MEAAINALGENPRQQGVIKLEGLETYRVRAGNYRATYEILDSALIVWVIRVADRKDIYRRRR